MLRKPPYSSQHLSKWVSDTNSKIIFFGKLVYSSSKLISQTLTLCLLFQQRILMVRILCPPWIIWKSLSNQGVSKLSQVPWPGDPERWFVSEGFLRRGLKRRRKKRRFEEFQYLRLKNNDNTRFKCASRKNRCLYRGLSMMAYFTVNHLRHLMYWNLFHVKLYFKCLGVTWRANTGRMQRLEHSRELILG